MTFIFFFQHLIYNNYHCNCSKGKFVRSGERKLEGTGGQSNAALWQSDLPPNCRDKGWTNDTPLI